MLLARFFEELGGRTAAARFHVFVASTNRFHSLRIVPFLTIKVFSENILEHCGRVLPMPVGVLFELRFPVRTDGDDVHALTLRSCQLRPVPLGPTEMRRSSPPAGGAAAVIPFPAECVAGLVESRLVCLPRFRR